MEINGKSIAGYLGNLIKKEVKTKKRKDLRLVTFLVGNSSDQLSFVRIKAQTAKKLGIDFKFIHFKNTPSFESFAHSIKEASANPKTTGIIIQQPLPSQLSTDSVYDYIKDSKEIEGHKRKTTFLPPIGLAILTVFKYIYGKKKLSPELIVNIEKDRKFFKRIFRNKKVVLIGRGVTGGKPIGKTLTEAKINYISLNSQTPDPGCYCRDADVIICAVGQKVITAESIKPGVVLINVGLRRENNRLKGDYDEKEIKSITGFYTPTPGGVGPIDVIYLYKNLIDAAKLQK